MKLTNAQGTYVSSYQIQQENTAWYLMCLALEVQNNPLPYFDLFDKVENFFVLFFTYFRLLG